MKKILCTLLCLCMLFSAALAEGPSTEEQELAFAKGTVQAMVDQAAAEGITLFRVWQLSDLDPEDVKKAAIVTVGEEQLAVLGAYAPGGKGALSVIAGFVNRQFSDEYAEASVKLAQMGDDAGIAVEKAQMVWLVYDYHLCLCVIFADGSYESVLMMSDHNVLETFSEEYIRTQMSMLQFGGEFEVKIIE